MTLKMAMAQDPMVQQIVEHLIESAGADSPENLDIQEVIDDLTGYKQHPLNLNIASIDELTRIHLLSSLQIKNLITYREKTGTIYSIYELASVEGFTPDVLSRIEPFVVFSNNGASRVKKKPDSDAFLRVSKSFAHLEQPELLKYEGSLLRYYLRIRHESTNFSFGYVGEKDPGESFFTKSNKHGFDYNSAFVNFKFGNSNICLFIGEFVVEFGQGLVAWQ